MGKKIPEKIDQHPSKRSAKQRKIKKPKSEVPAIEKTEVLSAIDQVKKLSEMDRLRFFELDTILQNTNLEIKNLTQEHKIDQLEFNQRGQKRQELLTELKNKLSRKINDQRKSLVELSVKYDFDPDNVSIDDQTGVIHEHKNI